MRRRVRQALGESARYQETPAAGKGPPGSAKPLRFGEEERLGSERLRKSGRSVVLSLRPVLCPRRAECRMAWRRDSFVRQQQDEASGKLISPPKAQ